MTLTRLEKRSCGVFSYPVRSRPAVYRIARERHNHGQLTRRAPGALGYFLREVARTGPGRCPKWRHHENQTARIGFMERWIEGRPGHHLDREWRAPSLSLWLREPLRGTAWHEPGGAHRRRSRGLLHHGSVAHSRGGQARRRTDGHLGGGHSGAGGGGLRDHGGSSHPEGEDTRGGPGDLPAARRQSEGRLPRLQAV